MSNPDNLQDWLTLLESRHIRTIDLGLDRCGDVFRRLGSPRPAKTVFTVAGTNGKGSTVAYLSACASACGQRFGTYTSPHIVAFNERICVMGSPVPDISLIEAFERIEQARGDISLSYFEFTTLAGFIILHDAKLDTAILEVGLGGRLDTVNLIDTDCAVMTPVGLDHQDYLGTDVETIAAEKAGIIRSGVPVVCSQERPPFAILNRAADLSAPVYQRNRDFQIDVDAGSSSDDSLTGSPSLVFSMMGGQMRLCPPALAGQHQIDNLAAALAAFRLLNPNCFEDEAALNLAIRSCRLPGRMQQVSKLPDIYVDVGHNPLAAEAVVAFFRGLSQQHVVCVLAMLADKDAESVSLTLNEVCTDWVCADSDGERGQSAETLAQRLKGVLPEDKVHDAGSMDKAICKALALAQTHRPILVFGSFTTVAAFIEWQQSAHAAEQA